jgi:hypothetical protein
VQKASIELVTSTIKLAKKGKPQCATLQNGVKLVIMRTKRANLRIETNINIAIETIAIRKGLLSDLAKTLTLEGKKLRDGLRQLTEDYHLIWETSPPLQNRTAALLIDAFAKGLPPSVLVLTSDEKEEPLKRCLGCRNRYSPVCKYCERDGSCSLCGTPMHWSEKQKDHVCAACGRTAFQDFYYCPYCEKQMEWNEAKKDYVCPACKRSMAELY